MFTCFKHYCCLEAGNDNSRRLQVQAGHSSWSWRALGHRCQLWYQESFPTTGG